MQRPLCQSGWHSIESLIDALTEQYGQAPLLELQRVAFYALSLRGQQAEARFVESRGDLLRLGLSRSRRIAQSLVVAIKPGAGR